MLPGCTISVADEGTSEVEVPSNRLESAEVDGDD